MRPSRATETLKVAVLAAAALALTGCASTPLYNATSRGDLGQMNALIDKGSDPNEVAMGDLPLSNAACRGNNAAVKLLLKRGANVNPDVTGTFAFAPLEQALICNVPPHPSTVALLLAAGARVTDSDYNKVKDHNYNDARITQMIEETYARQNGTEPPSSMRDESAATTTTAPASPVSLVSDVDRATEHGAERPDDFALVIGVEEYQSLPKADYGARDAQAVRRHLAALGVPERNIVALEGTAATGNKLKSYLEQWLPRNAKPDSTVFVYFSGHGAPDPTSGDAYLVPWDGDPMFLTTTGYPLKQFYADLAKLKAKRVVVALDACFSGAGGRSVLAKGARPLVVKVDEGVPASDKLVVFAAASGNEITGTLDEKGHGIFTYYLLKGLSGAAKNATGVVTPKSLYDYLKPRVQDEASRQNREQTPTFIGNNNDAPLTND